MDIDKIVAEAKSLGLAFVEDEFTEDDIYNPYVDRPNAESWLRETLTKISNAKV